MYFTIGNIGADASFPLQTTPAQSSGTLQSWSLPQIPIVCDVLDPRDLIKINEIFPGNDTYPPYVELAVHDNITIDSLSFSGDYMATGIVFSFGNSGMKLEKNSLLMISATGFWQKEGMQTLQDVNFRLVHT